jgi:hypothetical protein
MVYGREYCEKSGSYVLLMHSIKLNGKVENINSLAFGTPLVTFNAITKKEVQGKESNHVVNFDATYLGLPHSIFEETMVTVYPFDGSDDGKINFQTLVKEVRRRSNHIYRSPYGAIVGVVHLRLQDSSMMRNTCVGDAKSSLIAASDIQQGGVSKPLLTVLQGTSDNKIVVYTLHQDHVTKNEYDNFDAACTEHRAFEDFRKRLANVLTRDAPNAYTASEDAIEDASEDASEDIDDKIKGFKLRRYLKNWKNDRKQELDKIKEFDIDIIVFKETIIRALNHIKSFFENSLNEHNIVPKQLQIDGVSLFKSVSEAAQNFIQIKNHIHIIIEENPDKRNDKRLEHLYLSNYANCKYEMMKLFACITFMFAQKHICDENIHQLIEKIFKLSFPSYNPVRSSVPSSSVSFDKLFQSSEEALSSFLQNKNAEAMKKMMSCYDAFIEIRCKS